MTQAPAPRASFGEFAQFMVVGGIAAAINLMTRVAFDLLMPFELAVVLSYCAGMAAGFALFQVMLFPGRDMMQRHRLMRFALVNLFGVTLAWAVSSVMARQVLPAIGMDWRPFEIAHVAGVASPAISSYFLNKYYTFA